MENYLFALPQWENTVNQGPKMPLSVESTVVSFLSIVALFTSISQTRSVVTLRYFLSMDRTEDWWNIHQSSLKRKPNFDKMIFFRRTQACSFKEFWIWRSTKYDTQMDFFAFSAHKDFNLMNKIGDCSKQKSSKKTTPSFQTFTEEFKAVVFERNKMEHRD